MSDRYICPSPRGTKACRDSSLRCLVPAVHGGQQHPWSWDGAFPFAPTLCRPREAFLKGLSTTGWLLLDWGKPKAAHAKSWFSFFPSWDCFKIFLKAYCTKPLKIKNNPCANQRKPHHRMQTPKNACSATHTGRGVIMSLVPICQFISQKTTTTTSDPTVSKNWMQNYVQSVLITKHSKAS